MDTEFNYLYEDKYYENAVKNLKSTFYDIVEREEGMLNNLESRIATENDEEIKAKLLELWTKQNASLDNSIILFKQLKQSVRVIDSFVKELSDIDDKIVADIINSNNNLKNSRIDQMKKEDDLEDNKSVKQTEKVEDKVTSDVPENEMLKSEALSEEQIDNSNLQNSQEVSIDKIEDSNTKMDISPNNDNSAFEPVDSTTNNEVFDLPPLIPVSEAESLEVPDMKVVNEVNDGTNLPNTVDVDNIDVSSSTQEQNNSNEVENSQIDLPFANPSTTEELNNDEENIQTDSSSEEQKLVESESNDKIELTSNSLTTPSIILKENNDKAKAIIVNEKQYDNLVKSLDKQANRLIKRGLLTEDLIKKSNYSLEKRLGNNSIEEKNDSISTEAGATIQNNTEEVSSNEEPVMQSMEINQAVDNIVNQNPTSEDIEKMIDKANQLYKEGKSDEAQSLFDEISRLNESLKENEKSAKVVV